MPNRSLLWAMLFTVLLTCQGCLSRPTQAATARPKPSIGVRTGQIAPDFQLSTPKGVSISLSQYRGQPVLLNFFATWCDPCIAEMPGMRNVYKRYWAEGLAVIAVDLAESADRVTGFGNNHELTFPLLLDSERQVSRFYQVGSIPRSFFIDSNGIIRQVWYGSMKEAEIEEAVAMMFEIPIDPEYQPPTAPPPKPAPKGKPTITPTPHPAGSYVEGCVNIKSALVRSGPGQDFPAIGKIALDRCPPFDAVSADGDWLRLADPGQDGGRLWIAAEYITPKGDMGSLPVALDP